MRQKTYKYWIRKAQKLAGIATRLGIAPNQYLPYVKAQGEAQKLFK